MSCRASCCLTPLCMMVSGINSMSEQQIVTYICTHQSVSYYTFAHLVTISGLLLVYVYKKKHVESIFNSSIANNVKVISDIDGSTSMATLLSSLSFSCLFYIKHSVISKWRSPVVITWQQGRPMNEVISLEHGLMAGLHIDT